MKLNTDKNSFFYYDDYFGIKNSESPKITGPPPGFNSFPIIYQPQRFYHPLHPHTFYQSPLYSPPQQFYQSSPPSSPPQQQFYQSSPPCSPPSQQFYQPPQLRVNNQIKTEPIDKPFFEFNTYKDCEIEEAILKKKLKFKYRKKNKN